MAKQTNLLSIWLHRHLTLLQRKLQTPTDELFRGLPKTEGGPLSGRVPSTGRTDGVLIGPMVTV